MITGIPIPRVFEALQCLKDNGKIVKFVSNNSVRSDAEYKENISKYGITNFEEEDIIHPVKSMIWYIKRTNPSATVFLLISKAGIELLQKHGINTVNMDNDVTTCASFASFVLNRGPPNVDYVVADFNPSWGYIHLVKGLEYLKDSQCQLLLGGMDPVVPLAVEHNIPGYLVFYNFLTKHSNKQPIILGKPSLLLADILKERFNITDPKRCLFIGDLLEMDIQFGKSVGFQTLLVLSGANTKEDMLNAPEGNTPDYYADSVGDFLDLLGD
ncbi:uncharacterized protein isoform X2 [Musca autumnalis]|uniref:uncharacterized protein isoform X2 n=1 Tax=Musca autumnalis TaxID=221902 RepID=UPI003CF30FD9